MSERLTKTAIKTELKRRVDWYERSYPKLRWMNRVNYKNDSRLLIEAYGSCQAYRNMLEQVENGSFLGGGI